MALEQLRQLQAGGTPNRRDVEMQVQMYYLNPEGYTGEQVIQLAQRAAEAGVAFEPKTSAKRVMKNILYGAGSGATFGLLGLVPGLKPDALTSTEKGAQAVASALGIAVGGPAAVGGKVASKAVGTLTKAASGSGRVAKVGKTVEGLSTTGKAALESGVKYGFAGTTGTLFDEGLDPGRGIVMGSGAAAIQALRTAKVAGLVGKQQTGFAMQGGGTAQTNVSKELWKAQNAPYTGPVRPNQALVPLEGGAPPPPMPINPGAINYPVQSPTPIAQLPPRQFAMGPSGSSPVIPNAKITEVLNTTKAIKASSKLPKVKADRARELMRKSAGGQQLTKSETLEVLESMRKSIDRRTMMGKVEYDLLLDRIRQIKGS